ncbi:zf-HC2 domain-containing protein [Microbacterium sp. USHLN186]|uniref:zf-HC2 domain-containing protein n=1 Tax=Microbacterium sp. USHLN186 TaxID=3081286 RepID=UPI00301B225C
MKGDHERFLTWDAAYTLGALSAAERSEYEEHLTRCARCRDAVAELSSTVSLLSLLDAGDVERISDAGDVAPVRVLAAARERRLRHRRIGAWAVGAVAAVVVALGISVAALTPRPAEAMLMDPVAGAPVTASVTMTSVPWGTKLELTCEYDGYRAAGVGGEYALAIVADDGTTSTLSTWSVEPGATARLSAGTALAVSDIRAVEIRDASGSVVVRRDLD